MKKLHLSIALCLAFLAASSQKVYFLYIQTESEQPFYVKLNEKLTSSSATGYIILSKLVDSTYSFTVGFPQNKWPEQQFAVAVNKKDHGYLLKNFGEKGWGLFDLQSLTVQMAIGGKASVDVPGIEDKNITAFTDILSKAADDPSLRQKPVKPLVEEMKTEIVKVEPKKEEKKPALVKEEPKREEVKADIVKSEPVHKEPVITAVEMTAAAVEPKTESPVTNTKPLEEAVVKTEEKREAPKEPVAEVMTATTELVAEKKEESTGVISEKAEVAVEAKSADPYKMSNVKKWSESSTTDGFGLVFIDGYENGLKDTIRLVIPNPKPAVAIIKEEPADDKKFITTSELSAAKAEPVTEEIKKVAEPVKETVVEKPASVICKETATGDDFVRLRKKMASTETDDDMIAEAKKYFKTKCFSTWQLKNLAVLFLNDEGKYKFFDAAYPYVTDSAVFATLQSELKDDYYAGRFKAMLRN